MPKVAEDLDNQTKLGALAPLKETQFRRIWIASIFSNFSQLFLGVGAAWEMTRLSGSPTMVALVQTAMMLPLMIVTVPAGAIADMFDKRKTAMTGLAFASFAAAVLAAISFLDLTTPWILLIFCSLTGAGVALFSPSWQASIPEQVSRPNLPAAVALGTVSYNVARSFGPAVGGVIVLAAGAKAVFSLTSVLFMPLLIAFAMWRRVHVPNRLPPERIDRAIVGGARYALHSPAIKPALTRLFVFGLMGAAGIAMAPLVARNVLQGDAAIFGILLGSQGVGAVLGALFVSSIRDRFSTEWSIRTLAVANGLALVVIGMSDSLVQACFGYFLFGGFNILSVALLNVSIQLSAPRWVTARALSLFASSITAGVGIGAWAWGVVAGAYGIPFALIASGLATASTALLGFVFPLRRDDEGDTDPVELGNELNVALPLTMRSGPVAVEVEYDVDPERARDFYQIMMKIQGVRKRIGGFDWSISRDVANPALWIERYHCPTWGDYLRMRDRYTQSDFDLHLQAEEFNRTEHPDRVRRRLERPFGSVRWKADSLDPHQNTVDYIAP